VISCDAETHFSDARLHQIFIEVGVEKEEIAFEINKKRIFKFE